MQCTALAINSTDPKSFNSIFIWSGVLIALLLVAYAGYSYLKRWMNQSEESGGVGFTLSDLKKLHEQGKMSTQEYELTRNNMLAAAKKATDKLPEVLPKRGGKPPAP